MSREGRRNGFFNFFTIKAVKGQKARLGELDQKAVIILGLNSDDRGQFESRFSVSSDLGNAKFNSGFVAVGVFILWLPGVSVG